MVVYPGYGGISRHIMVYHHDIARYMMVYQVSGSGTRNIPRCCYVSRRGHPNSRVAVTVHDNIIVP